MPIVDVELVGAPAADSLAQSLADAIGEALGAPPGKVWVRVHTLSAARYAENGVKAPQPVFVTILSSNPPAGEALDNRVARITTAVAQLAERAPEHVHVLFEPTARGRVAFGGRVVR
jgi:phenylpyruvate tautomerase PptA (4-oxalocrotonate tautomerase family)